jgi:hypothetical protein
MVMKKSYTIGANITSHGPDIYHWNAESDAQEGINPTGILVNLEVHTGNQLEVEQTTVYNQNPIQTQELNRMDTKQEKEFTCPVKQGKPKSRRSGDTAMHLGKCNKQTQKIILLHDIITCTYPNHELNYLVNICIVS